MIDWREREPRIDARSWLWIGGATVVLAVIWMMLARPGEEGVSSSGFDIGGTGGVAAPTTRERRTQTGLAFVRRGIGEAPAVVPEALPGGQAPAAALASDAGAKPGAEPPAAANVPIPTDRGSLTRLGTEKGLLSKLMAKAMSNPAAVRLLLNNKTLVDAYFSRDLVRRNCQSGSALKSYLMNGSDPRGVSEEIPLIRSILQHPESASAALNSEAGRRLMQCPSVGEVARDPGTLLMVAGSNPALVSLLSDPNATRALSSNSQASSLLGGVQSSMGGSGATRR